MREGLTLLPHCEGVIWFKERQHNSHEGLVFLSSRLFLYVLKFASYYFCSLLNDIVLNIHHCNFFFTFVLQAATLTILHCIRPWLVLREGQSAAEQHLGAPTNHLFQSLFWGSSISHCGEEELLKGMGGSWHFGLSNLDITAATHWHGCHQGLQGDRSAGRVEKSASAMRGVGEGVLGWRESRGSRPFYNK